MTQDEDHLRLLAIFHYVCAGLAAFVSCFTIIHVVMGVVMIVAPEKMDKNPPPAALGWIFVVMGSLFFLAGWAFASLLAWAGRCLQKRKHYTFCLVMGGVACLFMPIGTALGIFTIIVLSRPSVKSLFGVNARPA
jgi:Ca2+/Na+ antiporter